MPDLETFKRWVSADWRAHASWREQARDDFRFIAGDQWTEEEKQILSDQARVPIVFNRAATIINSVVGSEINNRTEVRYFPRTMGDAVMNEVLTKGAEWFRDQAGSEEEDSQAFHDAIVSGLGWTEAVLDFEADPEGEPRTPRISPLEMCWDGSAERRGLVDAKRIARIREMDRQEAREMFEDAKADDLDARWLDKVKDDSEEPTRQWSDDDYSHDDDDEDVTDDKPDTVTIVQLQYRERRREVEYVDPMTGQPAKMPKRQFGRLMEAAKRAGFAPQIQSRDIVKWEWKQVFLGNEILLENQPCRDAPTFVPITGYWDNDKRQWFGLLRQMRDPQKFANKWLSQTLHIINSNSKGGVMVETDAVDDHRAFEENWAAADAVHWLRPGGAAKVHEKPEVKFPQALMQLTEFAISSIRDVSGVNQELLGLRDENQPGVLEYQRKQAAMTTLAMLFDALRQYRKQQGQVLLFYMREYMADGRLVRIVDEDGARYAPLQIDEGVEKYDVIVDDAPSSPNNKEKTWEIITNLMPVLVKAGLPKEVWGEIIGYAPFPQALIEKLQEYTRKADEPDPQKQQVMQLALKKLMAEIESEAADAEETRAGAAENMAKARKALAEAESEPVARMEKVVSMLRPPENRQAN